MTPEFVAEIRQKVDIVKVISGYVKLEKHERITGPATWKGLCPFHEATVPSLNVRLDPPVFHCFGCGVGGDVFAFLMKKEGLTFHDAVAKIAAGLTFKITGVSSNG